MSQDKVDEAIWFESLIAPEPEPLAPQPLPLPARPRWFRFLRRAEESAPSR